MRYTPSAVLFVGLAALACAAFAQQPDKSGPKADIAAGKTLFHQRCSVCHGINGDGNGTYESGTYLPPRQPAATDLTALSEQNAGVFPAARVEAAIHNTGPIPAHGTPEMPAWGSVFFDLKSKPKVYEQRVRDLTAYIESIQATGR